MVNNNPLDLKEQFPNYFYKWVFRLTVVLVIVLFLFTANSNDWRNDFVYVSCPENSFNDCVIDKEKITNNEKFPDEWDGIILGRGETIGEKPNEHYFKFKIRAYFLFWGSFLFNHLIFMLKEKKLYPTRREIKK